MTLPFSELLQVRSLDYKSPALEKTYQQFQSSLQRSLFQLLKFLLMSLLILLMIYFRASSPLFFPHLILAIATCLVLVIPTPWPALQNLALVLIFWLVELLVPLDALLSFDQDDKTLVFILGYACGAIEVILTSAIKSHSSRLWVQIMLTLTKALKFSKYTDENWSLIVTLGCVSFLSFIFFTYRDTLDRDNFKKMDTSYGKLIKLQTILADDFPTSAIIISESLKHIFYSNQYFTQNLHLLNQSESIETLFKKITLEFDDINSQASPDLRRISLHTFITETMNIHPRFNNRDVFNLYSLSQDKDIFQYHYEIKLRKILWGDIPAYIIIFNDVSDKQKATVLQEADEQRDRVIATITHELKTPINGILGLLDIIDCRSQDPLTKTYLDHCKNCNKLLLYLVNSIMDLSHLRQNKLHIEKTVFSLDELLKEMKSLYAFISEHRGLQFTIEKSPEVPNFIYTDKYRLISILVQLLGNAMKFTFKGSVKLKIKVSSGQCQKLIFIIEDSGVGIKEEDQIKLFNMFGQITEKKKNINHHGAGLGITIANELTAFLNNPKLGKEQVEFESVFNQGSIFKFRIDFALDGTTMNLDLSENDSFSEITREESDLEAGSSQSRKAIHRNILRKRKDLSATSQGSSPDTDTSKIADNKKRVLIVDDNPFNLVAASFIVSKLNVQPLTAANGLEAISMLQESMKSGQHYYFVLMDIQMPIMDGIQATKNINQMIQKGELYSVPVIALTAKKIDDQEKEIYKDCGMFDALGKPLVDKELKNILKRFSNENRR